MKRLSYMNVPAPAGRGPVVFINPTLESLSIQHEYDHLDGILCTMRAIDSQAFRWRPNVPDAQKPAEVAYFN